MEITFLGTGAGVPSKKRNVSSIALSMLQERNEVWLFDCGEATQHQILNTTIKPRKIAKIFITHMHGDHIFGLPGLLSSRSFQEGKLPVEIYGPESVKTYVETALKTSQTHLQYKINFKDVKEGILFEDDQLKVSAIKLKHGVPSYGYIIEQHDSIGPLLPEKLKERGVMPGPTYQLIKENEKIKLDDGTVIIRDEVTGPPIKGKKIAILGDTLPVQSIVEQIKHADVLIHEGTFKHEDEKLAKDYYHSTAVQAAEIAKQAHVKQLLLTHVSSRYHQDDLIEELNIVKRIFPQTEFAHDFYTFTVG